MINIDASLPCELIWFKGGVFVSTLKLVHQSVTRRTASSSLHITGLLSGITDTNDKKFILSLSCSLHLIPLPSHSPPASNV